MPDEGNTFECISDGFLCQCLGIPPFRCNWVIHFWKLPPVSVSWFVDVCGVHFVRFCIMSSRVFPLAGNPLDAVAKIKTGVVFKDQDDS